MVKCIKSVLYIKVLIINFVFVIFFSPEFCTSSSCSKIIGWCGWLSIWVLLALAHWSISVKGILLVVNRQLNSSTGRRLTVLLLGILLRWGLLCILGWGLLLVYWRVKILLLMLRLAWSWLAVAVMLRSSLLLIHVWVLSILLLVLERWSSRASSLGIWVNIQAPGVLLGSNNFLSKLFFQPSHWSSCKAISKYLWSSFTKCWSWWAWRVVNFMLWDINTPPFASIKQVVSTVSNPIYIFASHKTSYFSTLISFG